MARAAVAIIAVAVVAGLVVVIVADDSDEGTGGEEPARTEGEPLPADEEQPLSALEERGRSLFVERCGVCHTFEPAGTAGAIGPNLGDVPLDREAVLRAIEEGGLGSGNMPANLVSGEDADAVATYVDNFGS
jgi:mono/diheme cytochrome c family protein